MFIEIRDLKRGGFVPPIVPPPPMNQNILVYLTERLKFPTHLLRLYPRFKSCIVWLKYFYYIIINQKGRKKVLLQCELIYNKRNNKLFCIEMSNLTNQNAL